METNKQLYPSWECSQIVRFTSKEECRNLEYKYIMVDDKGGSVVWESGDNHKVDLSKMIDKYQGPENVVVVEDDAFNSKRKSPKVYKQGEVPVPDAK